MDCPNGRCGYEFTPELPGGDGSVVMENRIRSIVKPFSCWRPSWKGENRCIWHAKVDGKPARELSKHRASEPERLDGAYLANTWINDMVDFSGCWLRDSNFKRTSLKNADLSNVKATRANFRHSELSFADLSGGTFIGADFSDSNSQIMDATNGSFTGVDFSNSGLLGTDFTDSDLMDSNLSKSDMSGAIFQRSRIVSSDFSQVLAFRAKFSFSSAAYVDFSDSDLSKAKFIYSDIRNGDHSSVDATETDFSYSSLENSDFRDSTLYGTDFSYSRIFGTTYDNTKVDDDTTFGEHYDNISDDDIEESVIPLINEYWRDKIPTRTGDNSTSLKKKIWSHRSIEEVLRKNSLTSKSREHFIHRKNTRRQQASENGRLLNLDWWYLTISKYVMGYSEKPQNVVTTSFLVIISFSFLYTILGGVESTTPIDPVNLPILTCTRPNPGSRVEYLF